MFIQFTQGNLKVFVLLDFEFRASTRASYASPAVDTMKLPHF